MDEDQKPSVESTVRQIRRHSRKKYGPEERVRIVLEGLRGDNRRVMPQRRYSSEYVLQVEQGLSGGR